MVCLYLCCLSVDVGMKSSASVEDGHDLVNLSVSFFGGGECPGGKLHRLATLPKTSPGSVLRCVCFNHDGVVDIEESQDWAACEGSFDPVPCLFSCSWLQFHSVSLCSSFLMGSVMCDALQCEVCERYFMPSSLLTPFLLVGILTMA